MKWHPYACLFPMMSEQEISDLAEDIRENGLRHPIWIDESGLILDGRNRSAACLLIGEEPQTRLFVGNDDDKLSFVVSLNMMRRQLDSSQRAMVAAKLLPIFQEKAKARQAAALKQGSEIPVPVNLPERETGDARDKAGEAMRVSGKSVSDAVKVREQAEPEVIAAVESGKLAVSKAARVVSAPKEEQRAIAANAMAGTKTVKPKRPPQEWYVLWLTEIESPVKCYDDNDAVVDGEELDDDEKGIILYRTLEAAEQAREWQEAAYFDSGDIEIITLAEFLKTDARLRA